MPDELLFTIEFMPPGFHSGGFRCEPEGSDDEIGEYLASGAAARDQAVGFSRSYLVRNSTDEVIAYFTLLADAIRLEDSEADPKWTYKSAPAIKIARLGVREDQRGKGLAPKIFQWIHAEVLDIATRIGVRYITLDAVAAYVDFYRNKLGFVFTRIEDQPSSEADIPSGDRSMRFDLGRLDERPT